jgi:GT2 family glycosyltransferase
MPTEETNLAPDISIVIVTWNAIGYTRECLTSLDEQRSGLSVETTVVDNDSADGTQQMIRAEFPHVCLVENKANLGFAKANNIGISRCSGRYVCLVNSDVNVPQDCLGRMYDYMEANPAVGVSGPRMIGRSGKVERSYMRFPTLWNSLCNSLALDALFKGSRLFGGAMMTDFRNNQTSEVEVLNGWFLMVRREALDQVGLLDEDFFMYGEDIDWSFRFRKAGWQTVYFAGAQAIHYGGASSERAPVRFYIERQRASVQFWNKHHGRIGALTNRSIIFLHEVIRILGHSIAFLVRTAGRQDAALKIKRSWACIIWLVEAKAFDRATT